MDILVRVVDGETVVLDRARGLIHQLNRTASLIWDSCDGDKEVTEIAACVAGAFEVDLERAEQDVATAVQRMADLGLLAGDEGTVLDCGKADGQTGEG